HARQVCQSPPERVVRRRRPDYGARVRLSRGLRDYAARDRDAGGQLDLHAVRRLPRPDVHRDRRAVGEAELDARQHVLTGDEALDLELPVVAAVGGLGPAAAEHGGESAAALLRAVAADAL